MKNFQEFTTQELNTKLEDLKKELYNLRFDHAVGRLENGKKLTETKKDIARVLTIIRQRELGISAEPVKAAKKAKKADKED